MITSVHTDDKGTLHLVTDLGHTKVHSFYYNFVGDSEAKLREHQHRVEQLSPQPKVEFEREPEDMDDDSF